MPSGLNDNRSLNDHRSLKARRSQTAPLGVVTSNDWILLLRYPNDTFSGSLKSPDRALHTKHIKHGSSYLPAGEKLPSVTCSPESHTRYILPPLKLRSSSTS